MISPSDRQAAVELIEEACASGLSQKAACAALQLSPRTYQRWRQGDGVRMDGRPGAQRPAPANKLSPDVRGAYFYLLDCLLYGTLRPMSTPYIKNQDGTTVALSRYHCRYEEQELQQALELNPDLLPGNQINPDDPRRWLIIAREMPVPDPSTGTDRWSIDFLFADQSAIPTLIEVKRFEDTRARREVIGQMFEYAANGPHYWTAEELRDLARRHAQANGTELESLLANLRPDDDLNVDEYFQRLMDNLREGQIRIVFFLEEAPQELKSLVDYLNRQMERSEILLVEAAHYRNTEIELVVSQLFGYTEEARRVKRTVTVTSGQRRKWDRATFLAKAASQLSDEQATILGHVLDNATNLGAEISWGTGKGGSFSLKWTGISSRAPLTFQTDGKLWVNLDYLENPEIRETIAILFDESIGLAGRAPKFPSFTIEEWVGKIDTILDRLKQIANN